VDILDLPFKTPILFSPLEVLLLELPLLLVHHLLLELPLLLEPLHFLS
jgi:hypothetical protein